MTQTFLPAFGHKPSQLVGREQEISDFSRTLSTKPGDWHRVSLITGHKGMGKTALIAELSEWAEAQEYCVLSFSPEEDWSSAFIQLAYEKKVLAAVDNIQGPTSALRSLAAAHRSASAKGCHTALLLSGSPSGIESMLSDSVLSSLKRSHRIRLNELPAGKTAFALEIGLAKAGRALDQECLNHAAQATHGHPYLLQLVGSYLSDTGIEMDKALAYAKADFCSNLISPILSTLSKRDLEILTCIAEKDGPIRIAEIREELGVSDSYLQPYRSRLLHAGIVTSPRRGQLQCSLPHVKEALQLAR